jgi:flagellar protein FliO/FliZ
MLLLVGGRVMAQSTRPSAAVASQAFEDEPLRMTTTAGRLGDAKSAGNSSSTSTLDAPRVGLALMIVIGVIFLLRWAGRKMFLLPGNVKANPAIKVLSRTVLSPKQQVMLLQVGKRLVVVGDSGGRLSALSEITDPDEVAGLVGEVGSARPDRAESAIKSFRNLFGLAKQPFDETAAVEPTPRESEESPPDLMAAHEEIGGLLEKVKLMQRQFKRS